MKPEYTSEDQAAAWNDGYQAAKEEFNHDDHRHSFTLVAPHHTGGQFALSVVGEDLRVSYDDANGIIGVAIHLSLVEKLLTKIVEEEDELRPS